MKRRMKKAFLPIICLLAACLLGACVPLENGEAVLASAQRIGMGLLQETAGQPATEAEPSETPGTEN